MKKRVKTYQTILLALLLAASSCGTTNTGAILGGASLGGNVGSALGGLIGDSRHGWRGSYRGSAIGSIAGTLAGAAIGGALTAPRQREKSEDGVYQHEQSQEPAYSPAAPVRQQSFYTLQIRNIRFIDENRNHIIEAKENSKVIFEIMNEGSEPAYNVIPSVTETTGMKNIHISPSIMVEEILPHNGIKYTATISTGKRLKDGNIILRLAVTDSYGQEYASQEFSLPTQR